MVVGARYEEGASWNDGKLDGISFLEANIGERKF